MGVQPISVLIVDDFEMVRKAMRALFLEFDDIRIAGEAANGYDAIEQVKYLKPDLVLIDLSMPGMDGIEAIQEILAVRPEQRIIVLSAFYEDKNIRLAIQAGATRFISKDASPYDLVDMIRSVYEREPLSVSDFLWEPMNEIAPLKLLPAA